MPINETVLATLADAARLSTAQLEGISQTVLQTALRNVSNANEPAGQVKDMIAYAAQYGLVRELAAALLYTGADRPGLQNLLLGDGDNMANQEDNSNRHMGAGLDIVRLENRVGRLEDWRAEITHKVDALLQRAPLNWNIVGWGMALAIAAGALLWAATMVSR